MITMPMMTPWNICTPTLFRFIEAEYVDAFFTDGSLRLSSFEQFRKHTDEQRRDENEGESTFFNVTEQGGAQTTVAWASHGTNAYVLSATTKYDRDLMEAFGSDSYIRISDSTNFGMAIARHIPGLLKAFEGPCLYQDYKTIIEDFGRIDPNQFPNQETLQEFVLQQMGHYPLFLKEKRFAHQSEYRFVWYVQNKISDYLDIKVPDAMGLCKRPNSLTE